MKENLFELLLHLFERSLTQLKKKQGQTEHDLSQTESLDETMDPEADLICVKEPAHESTRILTNEERMKLTKASYQFLTRMRAWELVDGELFEIIMNQLQYSDSRLVHLEETRYAVRQTLADVLTTEQLAFLDLVIYPKTKQLTMH